MSTDIQHQSHWALRYSAIAFALLSLQQAVALLYNIQKVGHLLSNVGANVPALAKIILGHQWALCTPLPMLALISAAFILWWPRPSERGLKVAYTISILAVLASFAWGAVITHTLLYPLVVLGEPV